MKRKVLLVQPHSDDVLFSASKFLFDKKQYDKIVLFTVEGGDEKRVAEDKILCDTVGVDKYINSNIEFTDNSYYTYYKDLKFKNFNIENSKICLEKEFGKKFLKELKKDIRKIVKSYKKKEYDVVVCLGIGHPMHWFVRNCIEEFADIYYRDFPHSYKRKGLVGLEEATEGLKLHTEWLDEDLHELKFETAYQVYKSQRSLLFFEKGYIDKQLPEEFYVKE